MLTDDMILLGPTMARQYGQIERAQARSIGLSDRRIDALVQKGLLERVQPRVFRSVDHPPSWEGDLLATCLSTGGVASHRSAGHLLDLDGIRRPRHPEVTVGLDGPRRRGAIVHRSTQLTTVDATHRRGIPVTGIERTLIDLGGVVGRERVLQAVDHAIRRDLTSPEQLVDTLVAHARRGRNGSAALRIVLETTLAERQIPRSEWSRWVSDLLVRSGLPAPVLEHPVSLPFGSIHVDLAYPGSRLAIELQSHAWHRGAGPFERDARRRVGLTLAGWTVLEYTWAFFTTRPDVLASEVAGVLRLEIRRDG